MQKDKPNAIFVIGGPGCGKGTQCTIMRDKFGFSHLSTGSLLRQYCQSKSEGAEKISQMMKNGVLIPSATIVQIMLQRITSSYPAQKTFILDGFPRNHQNHDQWNKIVGQKINVGMVLYIQCDIKILRQRLLERAKTSGRADDNPQTIEKRFKTFEQHTVPVIEKYKKQHPKFISVNGMGTKQEVTLKVESVLKDLKLI